MLLKLLSKFNQVHQATTKEEIEAIARFRHSVYIRELHWNVSDDSERQMIIDDDDFLPTAYHFYVGTLENLEGCVRVRVWPRGEMPAHEWHAFSWDSFPNRKQLTACEIGRFIIHPEKRGTLVTAAMARRVYDFLAGEKQADLSFCYCRPGLVNLYLRLGARSYGAPMVESPVGMLVPLVSVLSDRAFYRSMKSPLAELVNDHFGPGRRPPVDTAPFAHLFHEEKVPLVSNRRDVLKALREMPLLMEHTGFLDDLDERAIEAMSSSGMIVTIDAGDIVIEEGKIEQEMYVILEGDVEVYSGDRVFARLGPGELFGEIAFFRGDGERTASVRAISQARLLILRRNFLDNLRKKHPDAVYELLLRLGGVLAERVSDTTTRLRAY